jgi:hypothetical protein
MGRNKRQSDHKVHSTVAAVAKIMNTTYAIVTYLCDCVTPPSSVIDAVELSAMGVWSWRAPRSGGFASRAGRAGRVGA